MTGGFRILVMVFLLVYLRKDEQNFGVGLEEKGRERMLN